MPNFFWDETTEDHILDARMRAERHDALRARTNHLNGGDEECSCRLSIVRSTDIDPPEMIRDRDCPVHGTYRDPDDAYDARRCGDIPERGYDE